MNRSKRTPEEVAEAVVIATTAEGAVVMAAVIMIAATAATATAADMADTAVTAVTGAETATRRAAQLPARRRPQRLAMRIPMHSVSSPFTPTCFDQPALVDVTIC